MKLISKLVSKNKTKKLYVNSTTCTQKQNVNITVKS